MTTQPPQLDDRSSAGAYLTEARALFMLIASSLLVYANSLGGEFVFDDKKQILRNVRIHSWANLLNAFTTDVWDFQHEYITSSMGSAYYRPFFTIYLTAGYKLLGLWAPGWHLINVAAHAAATVMVFYLLRQVTGKLNVAFAVALIFGVHSAHVESVAWVAAIPDPMMALFYVPALIWYDRFRMEKHRKHLWLSVLFFAFAVLSKETAMSLPVLLVCWEVARGQWRTKQGFLNSVVLLVPYGIVGVLYLAARMAVLGSISWKHPAMLSVPDHLIWMSVPYAVVGYLFHLVAPFDLSIIYGTSFVSGASDPRFYIPLAVLAVLAALALVFRRRLDREAWLALAFVIVPLLPVLNLKALHQEYIVQDRYLYLSVVGFAWLLAILCMRSRRIKPLLPIGLALLAVVFGAGTIRQNRVWRDSVSLWQQAVRHAPQFWTTHYNLGSAYMDERDYVTALKEFETALQLYPTPMIYNNMALAQSALGRKGDAEKSLNAALALDPALHEARNNLGTLFFERGDYASARKQFAISVLAEPMALDARFNLARTMAVMGDHTAAIREYQVLLAKRPADAEARQLLEQSLQAVALTRSTN